MRKLLLLLLLVPVVFVDASSISSIDMNIFIDKQGNAIVVETWNVYVNQGTEGWHPYYNLGNSEISDVSVMMDNQKFVTVTDWNLNASFEDKANKASLYYPNSDEVDVVFGITSYGTHEYVIQYRISNFVSTLKDADMVYWNLFPSNFSVEPAHVNIEIASDFKYSEDIEIYGYGKYGADNYLKDGKILIDSQGSVGSYEYLTILVKFPKGTFQTNNVMNREFDYYYNMAEQGAVHYVDNSSQVKENLQFIFKIFRYFLAFLMIFVYVLKLFWIDRNKSYFFGATDNVVRSDVPNFRAIPCNKDIYRAYWVARAYNLVKKKEDFLGTVLLKWIHDGNVRIDKVTKNGLIRDKNYDNVVFMKRPDGAVELEGQLYDYMYEASLDGKLEAGEFKRWCKKNYTKILEWFDEVLEFEVLELIKEGKVQSVEKSFLKVFKYHVYVVDSSMMFEAEQLAGLKKFLKEFTLIKKREPIEVQLWNEYLMYAQIFGMADEVASQFKKLYPEVIVDMNQLGYDYDGIDFIYSAGIKSASNARGGTGFHGSGGGGGGSSGGGGGGGGFR